MVLREMRGFQVLQLSDEAAAESHHKATKRTLTHVIREYARGKEKEDGFLNWWLCRDYNREKQARKRKYKETKGQESSKKAKKCKRS